MTLRSVLESHDVPGAVALVARGDEVEVAAVGEVREDSLFRVASVTKPITAAAVMLLVDDGLVALADPVERWLPELADPVVLRDPAGPVDDVVPSQRPITVFDLLTSRAGWGFPSDFSLPIVQRLFAAEVGLNDFADSGEWLAALAQVPLLAQPGDAWLYNTCSDLQGVLVERVSGNSLPQFMEERIFAPLEMTDTAFVVPRQKLARLAPLHAAETLPGAIGRNDWDVLPHVPSGAGGLASTAFDLLAFERMLLATGRPLLSEESVRLMLTDHLTPTQRDASTLFLEGEGWGFGGAVGESGRYGWVGGSGTAAHVEPAGGTAAILLTQVPMTGPTTTPLMRDFWRAAGI
jgi:CubicO group peptidase (beta-lactamase class C family)